MSKAIEDRLSTLEEAFDILSKENQEIKEELTKYKASSVTIDTAPKKVVLSDPGVQEVKSADGKKVKAKFALLRFTYADTDGNMVSTTAEETVAKDGVQKLYDTHPSLFVVVQ